MKQFLYLDHDMINSIIAQAEKGIVETISNEENSTNNQEDSICYRTDGKGIIGGNIFKIVKAETDFAVGRTICSDNFVGTTSKDVITKTLHDATFDIAYSHIHPLDCSEIDCGYGDYIQIARVFDFVDLDYLENMFAKDGFIEYLKKSSQKELQEKVQQHINDNLNREQLRKEKKRIDAKIKEIIAENDKQYDGILDIIKAFKQLIPYSRMLISNDGYLIPLDDQFFRIDPRNIGFKYGGEMVCVGMITNIIGENTNPCDENNIFANLQHVVNEALRAILPTKEKDIYVVHPLAVYYENDK